MVEHKGSDAEGRISRRKFIRTATIGGAAYFTAGSLLSAAEESATDVWILDGEDKATLMNKCVEIIDQNGGFGNNAKKLALKVNAAWARKPDRGATTHPALIQSFIQKAREWGISDIVVPENPCARPESAFTRSGIQQTVEENGAKMINLREEEKAFSDVKIEKGKSLQKAKVARHFLDRDVVINMPIAKDHGATKLTVAMKNWMGAVKDRGYWHGNDLHQCIGDFGTFLQPRWSIVDATRIMLTRGPQGPSRKMKQPNKLIVSRNQVAADAVSTRLFGMEPQDLPYLKHAKEFGLGPIDTDQIAVHEVSV